jgi:hypothetical protein
MRSAAYRTPAGERACTPQAENVMTESLTSKAEEFARLVAELGDDSAYEVFKRVGYSTDGVDKGRSNAKRLLRRVRERIDEIRGRLGIVTEEIDYSTFDEETARLLEDNARLMATARAQGHLTSQVKLTRQRERLLQRRRAGTRVEKRPKDTLAAIKAILRHKAPDPDIGASVDAIEAAMQFPKAVAALETLYGVPLGCQADFDFFEATAALSSRRHMMRHGIRMRLAKGIDPREVARHYADEGDDALLSATLAEFGLS